MADFGLYIHWPFCQSKCPYCDFNSHVAATIDHRRWSAAYLSEIERVAAQTPGRILSTVYFGGGTPSLMEPDTVADVIEAIRRAWPMANDPEITLEANPTSFETEKFRLFREAGVNRVSLGVQALNDRDLKALGRLHSAADALAAYEAARTIFPRSSLDLIYARQDQPLSDWKAELERALALRPTHLSLYQLTIEPGTAFGDRFAKGGLKGLPDEDLSADMYELTQDMTEAAGLPAYEISNHAAPGEESRHNLIYWRGDDYAGIGPGAHGRLTIGGVRHATETPLQPLAWLRQVEVEGHGESVRDPIPEDDAAAERVMMGLRMAEGMPSTVLATLIADYDNKINKLIEINMVESHGGQVRATRSGRAVLNAILRELLA